MSAELLVREFNRVADSPDAVGHLRRFILDLAVRGRLVEQQAGDGPAGVTPPSIRTGRTLSERAPSEVAVADRPFAVPAGWKWMQLASLAHIEMGQSPPSEHYNQSSQGLPFYQGKIDFGPRNPTPRFWCTAPTKMADAGDILISVRAPVGPTNVATELCCIGRGLAGIRPYPGLDRDFLLLSLRALEADLAALGFGTTFVAINKSHLTTFAVPLPPLQEQHRIVAQVDELMELLDRLDVAKKRREVARGRLRLASLHRLTESDGVNRRRRADARIFLDQSSRLITKPGHVAEVRETILDLAARGRLVRQDPVDADGVHQWPLTTEIATTHCTGLPPGWVATTLGTVASKITDGAHKTPTYVQDGIPFVSTKDFSGGRLDLSEARRIPTDEHSVLYRRCDPRRGDILIGRIGTLGKPVIVDTDVEFSLFVSVGLIQLKRDIITPEFGQLFLSSPLANAEFDRIKVGGGTHTNKLNLGDLHTVKLQVPPIAEQHRIVAKTDELMTLCDELEAALTSQRHARRLLLEALLREALQPMDFSSSGHHAPWSVQVSVGRGTTE